MTRTKVTARMTTGGPAMRISLAQPVVVPPADFQMESVDEVMASLDIQHCSMCQDGGHIWECDEPGCERAICDKCIEVPSEELSQLDAPNIKFTCVSCHWKMRSTSLKYFGFTRNGASVLNHFLEVKGTFETATNATVKSPPTILAHFYLSSIKHTAHFTIVEQLMAEYYHEDDSQLFVMDMPFNFGSDQDVERWNVDAAKRLAEISRYSHVVIFVTTHSDPDRGDLWLGYDKEERPCAAAANEWLEIVLGPFKAIVNGSMLFMLACGAVVNHSSSFDALKQGLAILGVANALAFDSTGLSTVNTVDILTKVTQSTIVHSYNFTPALEHTLKQCLTLGKHTNVLHFHSDGVTYYLWAHRDYQPWGKRLPLQCPQCGILNPWASTTMKGIIGYQLECKNLECGEVDGKTAKGRFAFQVLRPVDSTLISTGRESGGVASGWLKLTRSQIYDNTLL